MTHSWKRCSCDLFSLQKIVSEYARVKWSLPYRGNDQFICGTRRKKRRGAKRLPRGARKKRCELKGFLKMTAQGYRISLAMYVVFCHACSNGFSPQKRHLKFQSRLSKPAALLLPVNLTMMERNKAAACALLGAHVAFKFQAVLLEVWWLDLRWCAVESTMCRRTMFGEKWVHHHQTIINHSLECPFLDSGVIRRFSFATLLGLQCNIRLQLIRSNKVRVIF